MIYLKRVIYSVTNALLIYNLNTHGKLIYYADDTVLFTEGQSWDEIFANVNNDLRIIQRKDYVKIIGSSTWKKHTFYHIL